MQAAVVIGARSESQVLHFPEGLPGFESYREFSLLLTEMPELYWLQSLENEELYFLVMNPWLVEKKYDFEIDEETVQQLEITSDRDVGVLAIVTVPDDFKKMTVNLKAPLVINLKNGRSKQLVLLDSRYTLKHPVFPNKYPVQK